LIIAEKAIGDIDVNTWAHGVVTAVVFLRILPSIIYHLQRNASDLTFVHAVGFF